MTKDAVKIVETMLRNRQMENRRAYLVRGRRYQRLTSENLIERWVEQMKAWADNLNSFDQAALNDLGVEMTLREMHPPLDRIGGASQKIVVRSDAALKQLCADPESLGQRRENIGQGADLKKSDPSSRF
ncbi:MULTISPECIES: hypothetical protein [Bradyrhizobium]|uniref:hypothetical protein n=1 Tax=Bradyrhizobium TaxID=374 RepID=UPI001EDC8575|nr:hypothetical protein [Bradyrhizobium zhengyangense]MCG2645737.1 hypothetical protein [Bradyrhizobium zhengyangense]